MCVSVPVYGLMNSHIKYKQGKKSWLWMWSYSAKKKKIIIKENWNEKIINWKKNKKMKIKKLNKIEK